MYVQSWACPWGRGFPLELQATKCNTLTPANEKVSIIHPTQRTCSLHVCVRAPCKHNMHLHVYTRFAKKIGDIICTELSLKKPPKQLSQLMEIKECLLWECQGSCTLYPGHCCIVSMDTGWMRTPLHSPAQEPTPCPCDDWPASLTAESALLTASRDSGRSVADAWSCMCMIKYMYMQ